MTKLENQLAGWGRLFAPGHEVPSHDLEAASRDAVLFRGLGRSYGDAAIPPVSRPEVVATPEADRIRFFDRESGRLRAEAGLSLYALNHLFLNQGWFTPVTPGTQYVTIGGMVAADVHGKNHHADGCFGEHVTGLRMRVADGRIVECSPANEADLFWATIGGMGLTGHILEVEFTMRRIPSPWIYQESRRIRGIAAFVDALHESSPRWPFTVGWIDCLARGEAMGRGVFMAGRWAEPQEAPRRAPRPRRTLAVPFTMPQFLMNRASIVAFNTCYYYAHPDNIRRSIVHPESFFYPLDAIRDWNLIYGPHGFTQYQCVLPHVGGRDLAVKFMELLTSKGGASFLCVIKDCGAQGRGMISFPMPGISIALDIAMRRDTQRLVNTLNAFVIRNGGRIYLAKDALTRADDFRAMEPRLDAWLAVRRKWDPENKIRSALGVRLFGDKP